MDVASFLGTPPAAAKPRTVERDIPLLSVQVAPEAVASSLENLLEDARSGNTMPIEKIAKIASTEQEVVFSDTTPSGMLVEYQAKPKRLYRVNGVEVPSVTTILKVLDKPALPWWGMKVGVAGVLELFKREVLKPEIEFPDFELALKHGDDVVDVELVVELLKQEKLTTNHALDRAGDRGVNVHDAFEMWAKSGELPRPSEFPEEERGYVRGLCAFISDAVDPEPVDMEIMIGSDEHGFAGRYDARLRFDVDAEMVTHRTPVRGPKWETVSEGTYLCDLKTSKSVYPESHFRQLEAYEGASIEGGYEPTDGRYVIHVDADGNYRFVRSIATFEDFLVVLAVHQSNARLKGKA